MLKYLLPSVSLILYSGTVYAACGSDCKIPPTCSQMGYRQDISCPEGFITCPFDSSYKWCKEYTCADGRYQNAPLSAQEGYSCSSVNYHGRTCYDCTCAPQAGKCKYNAADKGTGGVLSSPCCNGNYNTCISSCGSTYTVSRPANSYIVNTCTACGTTYYNWKCKSGYLKNAAGTACVPNACEGFGDQCPTGAICYRCLSGTTYKYMKYGCRVGYTNDPDDNTCYNCVQMQIKLNNVTNGREYYLYCHANNDCRVTEDTTTCSGSGGNYTWYDPCIKELTNVHDPYYPSFDPISGNPAERYCYRSDKSYCEAARDELKRVLEHHNEICPSHKVTPIVNSYDFHCDQYVYSPNITTTPVFKTCYSWRG